MEEKDCIHDGFRIPIRYHLQALRHFYALACERRLVVPRDVRSGDPVYAHLRVEYAGNETFDPPNVSLVTRAPFVLPELKYITEVTLMDDRYHGFSFKVGRNWDELQVSLKLVYICFISLLNYRNY